LSRARSRETAASPASGRAAGADAVERDREEILELLAEFVVPGQAEAFVERFYERFFRENPEVVPLFGTHGLSEREEMMQETLRSLLALHERQAWLEANLRALGSSHAEYGVTTSMYPPFVDAFLATLREWLGSGLSRPAERELRRMLEEITDLMARAGQGAGASS
jgi:hemoglobin-like flavoprotein